MKRRSGGGGLSSLIFMLAASAALVPELTGVRAQTQDEAPPLSPPALEPPLTEHASKPQQSADATKSRCGSSSSRTNAEPSQPLLLIPGVTAPAPIRPAPRSSRGSLTTPPQANDPPLPAPQPASRSTAVPRSAIPSARALPTPTRPASEPIPLSFEPIGDEPPAELGSERLRNHQPPRPEQPRSGSSHRGDAKSAACICGLAIVAFRRNRRGGICQPAGPWRGGCDHA